jgi:biopolymer transport protein ExbD
MQLEFLTMPEVGFYPSRRLRKRRNDYFAYLNLWPFAGMMFGLLFIIMMMTVYRYPNHYGDSVDLPVVENPAALPWANREDAVRLVLTRDGTLYFGYRKCAVSDLPREIVARVASGAERRVYLSVDARVKYGDVKRALDCVRDARIESVSFLAYKRRSQ